MPTMTELVRQHYGAEGAILQRIDLAAEPCDQDDLASVHQTHCRTGEATTELAALAQLRPGMHVLDIGAGWGESARHLAATIGVKVTGIDIVADYVHVARQLAQRAGLDDLVSFERANALSAQFPSETFDCVWLQHVLPNIVDKPRLLAEARRVLRPHGCLALHEVVAIDGHGMRFPVPWARTPVTNFVAREGRLRQTLESAGFALRQWRDTSAAAAQWCRDAADRADSAGRTGGSRARLDGEALDAIVNVAANIDAGRIAIVMGVFEKVR